MKFFIFLLASLCEAFAYNNSVENPCQQPNGDPGDCVPITDCNCLNRDLEMTNKFTKNYIRRSECGFNENGPKVCCPLKDSDISSCYKCKKFHYVSSSLLPGLKECGFGKFNLGIIGGHPVVKGEFPWMAALEYISDPYYQMKSYKCGGSLINERYVLTAAHCINDSLSNVILGEVDLSGNNTNNSTYEIEKKIVFKSYDSKFDYHDIALLRLKQKVEYSEYIRPICLPTTGDQIFDNYIERMPHIAGWGTTKATSVSDVGSSILMTASVYIKNCRRYYDNKDYGQLCAGKTDTDACFGDSGGPLMLFQRTDEGSNWFAIGIVSGGLKCASPKQSGIYAKVSKYMYWIVDNLEP